MEKKIKTKSPDGISILRSLELLLSIFFLTQFLRLVGEIYNQISSRLHLGIDLTDESWNLYNINAGRNDFAWAYSGLLKILLKICHNSISIFRLAAVLYLLILTLSVTLLAIEKKREYSISFISTLTVAGILILQIPSTFRYLLITPGYQWLLMVSGIQILLFSILIEKCKKYTSRRSRRIVHLLNFSLGFSLFEIFLCRATGFLATIPIVFIAINQRDIKTHLKQTVSILASFLFCGLVYLAFRPNYIRDYLGTINQIRHAYAGVYSLGFQVHSFSHSFLMFLLPLLGSYIFGELIGRVGQKFTSAALWLRWMKYRSILIITAIIYYSRFGFDLGGAQSKYLLTTTILSGVILGLQSKEPQFYKLAPVAFLPYTTLFGSSIPSGANWQPYLATLGLLLIISSIYSVNTEDSRFIPVQKILLTVFLLFNLTQPIVSQRYESYEKDLSPIANSIDQESGLYYSESKLKSINNFREDASKNGFREGDSILDLSYWHPGLVYLLRGKDPQPQIGDKFWISSLDSQLSTVMPLIRGKFSNEGDYILIEVASSLKIHPSQTKVRLDSLMKGDPLSQKLKSQNYNPFVEVISVYRSQPVDLTLTPSDAVLLRLCKS
jgi:hypothetical protein